MRWPTTGGCFTILACAVLAGCATTPQGPPTTPAGGSLPAESGAARDTATAEPGATTSPAPGGVPATAERTTRDLPGVPGSPVTYDVTNFEGHFPDEVEAKITEQLRPKLPPRCRDTLCGITFDVESQDGGNCVTHAAPPTVHPGEKITIFLGQTCPPSSGQVTATTTEPAVETTTTTTARTTTRTTGTTGSGR
ncbi:hypothetical protein ACIGNX_10000 [Actinosynnema sp. NPDC053489]|uniref:hypothetical protein n=1 Tax=Actinosynnema sp. NPDC053489 TaxID=3363916 RepID=UPI0037C90262